MMNRKDLLVKMLTVASLTAGSGALASIPNYSEGGVIECSKSLIQDGWFSSSKHDYFTKIDLNDNTITFKHLKNDEVKFTKTYEVKLYQDSGGNAVIRAKVPHSSAGDIKETEIGYYNYKENKIEELSFVFGNIEGGQYINVEDLPCD